MESSGNNLTETEKKDITETDVDNYHNYDYIIENDNYNILKEKTKKIMEEIL